MHPLFAPYHVFTIHPIRDLLLKVYQPTISYAALITSFILSVKISFSDDTPILTLKPKFQSENGSISLPDCGDAIDPLTFEQILEMDDDEEEREFSKSIVYGFFDQAENTFTKMDSSL